jgi:hypothetical protein
LQHATDSYLAPGLSSEKRAEELAKRYHLMKKAPDFKEQILMMRLEAATNPVADTSRIPNLRSCRAVLKRLGEKIHGVVS